MMKGRQRLSSQLRGHHIINQRGKTNFGAKPTYVSFVCFGDSGRESAKEKRLRPWERVEAAHIELIEIEVMLWSPSLMERPEAPPTLSVKFVFFLA
jgi:hypothetical protein